MASKSECDCPYEDYCKHMVAVVYAAAAQDKDAAIDEKPAPTADSVMTLLSTLSHEDLLEVIDLALQDKPKLAEHISLWFDRFQTRQDIKRVPGTARRAFPTFATGVTPCLKP